MVGVVAAVNVLNGLPKNRTSIGAALTDTTTDVVDGAGIAVSGTLLATVFSGSSTASVWTPEQSAQFERAATLGGLTLTAPAVAACQAAAPGPRLRRATLCMSARSL